MDKEKAKEAIAQIDYQISVINQTIASYKQLKQRLKSELSRIKIRKKARLKSIQDDINRTRLPQQKTSKRATKERESKSFDSQITSKQREIERVDSNILDKEKEIANLKTTKQGIKLAMQRN